MGTGATAVVALIPAAGRGVRFGATQNKVLVPLAGKPLLGWTLEAFARAEDISGIVLIGSPEDLPQLQELGERYGGGKVRAVVRGGDNRQESVRSGLAVAGDAGIVLVHDGARPCITPEIIARVVAEARRSGAATAAVPVADTLARADTHASTGERQGENIPRDQIRAIQTPQGFRRDLLWNAHQAALEKGWSATDDARLVSEMGHPVQLVPGSPLNLKVTLPDDLRLAGAILSERSPSPPVRLPELRIGHGYDVHAFAEGRKLFLGGVEFPEARRGLLGHSDADALLHALCDALLGAAGMGDIGRLFPPSDLRHKDRRSTEFLEEVQARLEAEGWQVANVDISVLAEAPKIGPRAEEIRQTIASLLHIAPAQVGLKATTSEGMGFVGRGEGIAVYAVVLLHRFQQVF